MSHNAWVFVGLLAWAALAGVGVWVWDTIEVRAQERKAKDRTVAYVARQQRTGSGRV